MPLYIVRQGAKPIWHDPAGGANRRRHLPGETIELTESLAKSFARYLEQGVKSEPASVREIKPQVAEKPAVLVLGSIEPTPPSPPAPDEPQTTFAMNPEGESGLYNVIEETSGEKQNTEPLPYDEALALMQKLKSAQGAGE